MTAHVLEFAAGLTRVRVVDDARSMGAATARFVADAMKAAAARGERPALWLMAAPSAFAFYSAFAELASGDADLAALCRRAIWYQFDDYPIPRGDRRFPATFRHLLETHFFGPLQRACGELGDVRLLEIGGDDDDRVCEAYARDILQTAQDPSCCLIELKGIGMDGHWGFHGAETPLDAPPGVIAVPMSAANVHQQKRDWPQHFHDDADVPAYARTCTVSLFLEARIVVDNVPQASKAYSVLATYGSERVVRSIPSSAIKVHPDSHAYVTQAAAWALLAYRRAIALDARAKLSQADVEALAALWASDNATTTAENVALMRSVLRDLGML